MYDYSSKTFLWKKTTQRTDQWLPGVGGGRRAWLQSTQGGILGVIEMMYHDRDGGWEPCAVNI